MNWVAQSAEIVEFWTIVAAAVAEDLGSTLVDDLIMGNAWRVFAISVVKCIRGWGD